MISECIYNAYAIIELRNTERLMAASTKPRSKNKKKDAQLVLRLNKELRNRFVDACNDMDTTAAREVRRFIKRYLKRYDKGELEE